jgi:tyrosine-specific transport protein
MESKSKTFGSILIVSGTAIGAGMLALPLTSAGLGWVFSIGLLISMWLVTTYTALLTLQVSLVFPRGSNFQTMAKATLGNKGTFLMSGALLFLSYALLAAYTAGGASFLKTAIGAQGLEGMFPCLFLLVFGGVVAWKTAAVDYTNRLLFILKVGVFGAVVLLLLSHVQGDNLFSMASNPHSFSFSSVWLAIPIFFTSFGFHGSIPSLVTYMGNHPQKLKKVIVIGSAIPLGVYVIWQTLILGILPAEGPISFSVLKEGASVSSLIQEVNKITGSPWIQTATNLFSLLAILTSFLGVSLGLLDFFQDILAKRKIHNRSASAALTFVPPLGVVLFYPEAFIQALSFAALALVVLAIVLPVLMVRKLRQSHSNLISLVPWEKQGLWVCLAIGIAIFVIEGFNIVTF